jgi:uncharacterized protein (TIGR00369 family)
MDVDPKNEALIREVLFGSPVARALGIKLQTLEVDRVVLQMPFSPENVTLGRIVHGGVIATLIDIAGAAASFSGVDPDSRGGATSSLAISYLAAADGADLMAEARIIQRGRSQTVAGVSVQSANGTLVAQALSTNRVFSVPR